MAKLRLDTKDGAMTVITPGNAAASKLVLRITHDKSAMRMPPASSGLKLTPAQIATLKQWIEEGAPWNNHWSFDPPKRLDPPAVTLQSWPRNSIDNFVLARLEKEGLQPVPRSGPATLLRRVSLDLTGLPPTPAEVEAFLADKSPDAYEKAVDRLLGSPRYGERMAMHWLDARPLRRHQRLSHRRPARHVALARLGHRRLQRNMPLRPVHHRADRRRPAARTPRSTRRIATGFNRNHRINDEGGIIPEEYRVEYVVDRVETTATVWLGLTMGCARCHDHKYDPITQRDFYQLLRLLQQRPRKRPRWPCR